MFEEESEFVSLYKGVKYVLVTSTEDVDGLEFNGTIYWFHYINDDGTIGKKMFTDYAVGDTFKAVKNAKVERRVVFNGGKKGIK